MADTTVSKAVPAQRDINIRHFPEHRLTVAWKLVEIAGHTRALVAFAQAAPQDNWCRRRGRDIAIGRLECKKEGIKHRLWLDSPPALTVEHDNQPAWDKALLGIQGL